VRLCRAPGTRVWVLVVACCSTSAPTSAQGQVVRGVLSDEGAYTPVPLGLLTLVTEEGDTVAQTLADEAGFFQFHAPEAGRFHLIASAVGYRAIQSDLLEVETSAVLIVELTMRVRPIPLPGFTISTDYEEPERPGLAGTGFYQRASEGRGEVIWPGQIVGSDARYVQALFYGSRTAAVRQTQHDRPGPWHDEILLRDLDGQGVWCTPALYIDGVWVRELNPGESVADAVPVSELLAVEMYQWPFYVPTEYQGSGDCGVVLFWTRGRDLPPAVLA